MEMEYLGTIVPKYRGPLNWWNHETLKKLIEFLTDGNDSALIKIYKYNRNGNTISYYYFRVTLLIYSIYIGKVWFLNAKIQMIIHSPVRKKMRIGRAINNLSTD